MERYGGGDDAGLLISRLAGLVRFGLLAVDVPQLANLRVNSTWQWRHWSVRKLVPNLVTGDVIR